jgi:uncharacterized protein (TIGR03083 family)
MSSNDAHVAAYDGLRTRVADLLRPLDDVAVEAPVPATPAWQVRDLVAHVVGVAADVALGRTDRAGSDAWTEAQVEERRDRTIAELLAEWDEQWPAFCAVLASLDPFVAGQIVFDATTHEHDLRGALDRPGARDSDAMDLGWAWATALVGQMRDGYGAGALEIRTERGDVVVGSDRRTTCVTGTRFELWRAMTGRRCVEQVLAFEWIGAPAVDHLCVLPPRATPLEE